MTPQIGPQIIKIQMLSNISRSKLNQAMNFDQLIEIFFLKNHTQNVVEKLVPDTIIKKKLSITLNLQSEIFLSYFCYIY